MRPRTRLGLRLSLLLATTRGSEIGIHSEHVDFHANNDTLHVYQYSQVNFTGSSRLSATDAGFGGLSSLIVSHDGWEWVAVLTSGRTVMGMLRYTYGILDFVPSPLQIAQFIESERTTNATSVSTVSGVALGNPHSDGFYLRTDSETMPIQLFPSINSPYTNAGSAFNQQPQDPVTLCPSFVYEELAACPSAHQTIESISAESGESVGSIVFVCEHPSEDDGLLHGWVCNPSTGESSRFMIDSDDGWNLVDLALCPNCDPSQLYLLSVKDGAFAVDTVLLSTLLEDGRVLSRADDLEGGHMRLFDVKVDAPMQTLSVIRDPFSKSALRVFVASSDPVRPAIMSFTILVSSSGIGIMADVEASSTSYSLLIILILLLVGVAVPFGISRSPWLRAKMDNWKWKKESALLGLDGEECPDDVAIHVHSPGKRRYRATESNSVGKPQMDSLIE